MPIHDWSQFEEYRFYDFQSSWYVALSNRLNNGGLPCDFYSLIGQMSGDLTDIPSIRPEANDFPVADVAEPGTIPPMPAAVSCLQDSVVSPGKRLTVYSAKGDHVVAIIEIVSRGNKSSKDEFDRFVVKAAEAIRLGIHLLVIDLHPPTTRDPQGIHGAIASQMGDHTYEAPPDKPLTLVSYVAMPIGTAYIEPVAVGDVLPPMPLFLDEGHYVNVPLEETYMAAFRGVPRRWKPELEGTIRPVENNVPNRAAV